MRTGARISDYGSRRSDFDGIERMLRDYDSEALLRAVRGRAQPWRKAIDRWLDVASEENVRKLLDRLDLSERERVRAAAKGERKRRVSARRMEIAVGTCRLQERPDGLYLQKRDQPPQRIFDAQLYVDRIVGTGETKRASCSLVFDERRYRFAVDALDERRFRAAVLQTTLEAGLPIDGPGQRSFPLLRGICRLHPPKKHRGYPYCGWHAAAQRFQYPHNQIREGELLPGNPIYVPRAVGPRKRYMRLRAETVDAWRGDTPELQRVWSLLYGLLPACLARLVGQPAPNTLLAGEAFLGAFPAIVRGFDIWQGSPSLTDETRDDWPAAPRSPRKSLLTWSFEGSLRGGVCPVPALSAALLARLPQFTAILPGSPCDASAFSGIATRPLIPFYLRYCTDRPPQWQGSWNATLRPHVAQWLASLDVDPTCWEFSERLVIAGGSPEAEAYAATELWAIEAARLVTGTELAISCERQELCRQAERLRLPFPEALAQKPVFISWDAAAALQARIRLRPVSAELPDERPAAE